MVYLPLISIGAVLNTMMPLGGASPVHSSGNIPQSNTQASTNITTNASNKSNNVVISNPMAL